MRVLHRNRNYLSSALHQAMVEHLDDCGVESQVFVPVSRGETAVIEPNQNVFVSYCFNNIDRCLYGLKQLKITHAIEKNINVKSFDILHAYTLFTDGNVAMKLARKYDKPFVVAIRDTDVNVFFARMIHLHNRGIKIMRAAQRIFFLSDAYRKQVFEKYVPKQLYGELFSKTMIVPNGIDDFWFDNQWNNSRKLGDKIKIIFAGQVIKRKNIPTIKAAIDILKSKGMDLTLTVIGKIVDRSEFDKIKNDVRTTYLPAMPKEKLIEQYRLHDVFVMPSFRETFGLVYAEALTQSLPVVYTKGQGFDGQFKEGYVGYHCDACDACDVAKSIEKVVEEYDEIQTRCMNASLKFKWKDICEMYRDVYNQVAKNISCCKDD